MMILKMKIYLINLKLKEEIRQVVILVKNQKNQQKNNKLTPKNNLFKHSMKWPKMKKKLKDLVRRNLLHKKYRTYKITAKKIFTC